MLRRDVGLAPLHPGAPTQHLESIGSVELVADRLSKALHNAVGPRPARCGINVYGTPGGGRIWRGWPAAVLSDAAEPKAGSPCASTLASGDPRPASFHGPAWKELGRNERPARAGAAPHSGEQRSCFSISTTRFFRGPTSTYARPAVLGAAGIPGRTRPPNKARSTFDTRWQVQTVNLVGYVAHSELDQFWFTRKVTVPG